MTIETDLVATIGALCGGRVYPDLAPHDTARPYVTYQQVGGQVINPVRNDVPGLRHGRVQINVWADTRQAANVLMRQIEDALRPSPLLAQPMGALIARFDEAAQCRGAQQDFGIWWS